MKKFRIAALAALIALAGCTPSQKESPLANDPNTITLADIQTTVTWIKDNAQPRLMSRSLFPTAPDSLIEALSLADGIPASMSAFLMHFDGQWLLFDTGLGADKGGQLMNELAQRGLSADDISHIYLTHFHGDHIGGMLSDGKVTFANATIHANHIEYMYWLTEVASEKSALQRSVMDAYKERLQLFAWGDTLANGIIAVSAPGHTPGHTAFQKENLLVVGDLMHGAALQMEHPEYSGNYDVDKEEAAKTRIRILDMVRKEHLVMAGMHLPEPAIVQFKGE